MAIFDSFDGADGVLVSSRPGWLSVGSTAQPVLNGAGGVRTVDTSFQTTTALTVHNAADTSHFAEAVLGSDALASSTTSGNFVAVKTPITGSDYAKYFGVVYDTASGVLRLREGTSNITSSAAITMAAGDTVRLEAQMNGDNTAVDLRVFVNGTLRIGPVTRTSLLTNTGVGFRARTGQAHNSFITSFSGGSLTPSAPPVLSEPQATASGTTSASGSVVTSAGGGNIRFLVNTSPTATEATVIASGNTLESPQAGFYAVGPVTGLTPNTTYYMHFVQESPAGTSNVVSSGAFTTEALPVTLVLAGLKNNTGTVLTNQTGVTVHLYDVATGNKVVTKTGQTSDVNGTITLSDSLLVSGTQYRAVIVLASGAEGMAKVSAS